MNTTETKARFIDLRANGASYRKIGKELDISLDTCSRWEKELKDTIADKKADRLNELYNAYAMTKEARIKAIGETVKRLQASVDQLDLTTLPPEKLLDLNLKYRQALQSEYVKPSDPIIISDDLSPKDMLGALADLLNRTKDGEVDEAQAGKEVSIITNFLKAYEQTALKEKVEAIESTLQSR